MNVTPESRGEIESPIYFDAKNPKGKDEDIKFTGWRPWKMEQVHFRQFLMTFYYSG